MKAVILAGGEGTRLRPLSLGLPKPMSPLFDKPVMEHIISLLRRSGITEIAVTLHYMPRAVTDHFGDGAVQGVHLRYFTETEPLGTAGGVKNCMPFLGDEDFLVISGDAVCDLDLKQAMDFHATRRPAATLVLHRHPTPLEYGLVLTDPEGRVERFVEKPAWGQVVTNQVNTGIYLLTRRAMDLVPEGKPFDFARDLFPALMERGEALYGCVSEGYWCDMGDCRAYLDCVADALSGKVKLDLGAARVAPGIWSASPLPADVELVPPCYLGANVTVGPGSLIGPHVALGAGSTVGKRALIQRSVFHGASAGDRTTLYGAILCKDARVHTGAVLNEGAVLGEGAAAGRDAILLEGARVWPRRVVGDGVRLGACLTSGSLSGPPSFSDGGILRGSIGEELTAEVLLLLGGALGAEGTVGVGHCGGEGARMLAQAACCGVCAAGAKVLEHDAAGPSAAAWLAENWSLPVSLFVEQVEDMAYLRLFDRQGLPLGRARERKLEGALLRGEQSRVPACRVGRREIVSGVGAAYSADAARRARLSRAPLRHTEVSVLGRTAADRYLAEALSALGCCVGRQARPGVPAFRTQRGGLRLLAWDEEGEPLSPEVLLTIVALIEYEAGEGNVAVPPDAPAAIDAVAEAFHGSALRLNRDGERARARYAQLPWLRDALFAACRICAHMGVTGERLHALAGRVPHFSLCRREVALRGDRGAVMQALAEGLPGLEDTGAGLRLRQGESWVYLAPLTRRAALRVVGEAVSAELARELCDFYAGTVRALDPDPSGQK